MAKQEPAQMCDGTTYRTLPLKRPSLQTETSKYPSEKCHDEEETSSHVLSGLGVLAYLRFCDF
jgi:hypothetical protein